MARPYSLDLRARVVAQVARAMTRQAQADLNGIVSSTVTKWCGRSCQSGTPVAKPMGGHLAKPPPFNIRCRAIASAKKSMAPASIIPLHLVRHCWTFKLRPEAGPA